MRIKIPSITLAEKLILLIGLKKGEAYTSLIMLSFPKKTGRKTSIIETIKRY